MIKIMMRHTLRRSLNLSRFCSTQSKKNVIVNDEFITVRWSDGSIDEFPHFYLRENCNCSRCFQPVKNARTMFAPTDLDIDVSPESVDVHFDKVNVQWTDGHSSVYSYENLRSLRYKPMTRGSQILTDSLRLWGNDVSFENDTLPVYDFNNLMIDDDALYNWLVTLTCKTGIAKLENIPDEGEQLKKLGDRTGYLMSTTYGMNYNIEALSDDNATDTGYSSDALPLHTDYVFTGNPPAIAILHCLSQTESVGGVNQWIDGFYAANKLYENDRDAFNLLTQTPVAFRNKGSSRIGDFHTSSSHTLISLDTFGKLSRIGYSDEFRDRQMPLEPKRMKEFYKAYKRFTELLLEDESSFWYKMKNGEAVSVNNHRILHARNSYEDNAKNKRVLHVAYMDWDCVHSKIRMLAQKQRIPSPVS